MTNHKSILPNTNLRQLRNRTKDLHKALEAGDPRAIRRIGESHPRFCGLSQAKVATAVTVAEVTLADAQLVIARELGFDSWPKLKARLDAASYPPSSEPGPAADSGALPPYYGARGATYFQQVDVIHLGDDSQTALKVQGELGLHSQAGRRRGKWVSVRRTSHFTSLVPNGASWVIRLASEPPDRPESAQVLPEGPENANSTRHGGFLETCPRTEMHPSGPSD